MAYDKIPKTNPEALKLFGTLYESHESEKMDNVYSLWKGLTDDPDIAVQGPLAFQSTSKNQVKVARAVKVKYATIGDLKKAYGIKGTGLKISFGDGSRGGRGKQNAGSLFEEALERYLRLWKEEGEVPPGPYHQFAKDIIKHYDLEECEIVEVMPMGALNQKRPMKYLGNKWQIGEATDTNYNIGAKVTDITLKYSCEKSARGVGLIYLSLKTSGTTTMSNLGVTKFFSRDQIESGAITHETGLAILKTFGINNEKFCQIFKTGAADQGAGVVQGGGAEMNVKYDRPLLRSMILGSVGYGYHYCHQQGGGNIYNFEMTKGLCDSFANPTSVDVYYGGQTGTGVRINIEVNCPGVVFKFNIRDTSGGRAGRAAGEDQGGGWPDKLQSGYKFDKENMWTETMDEDANPPIGSTHMKDRVRKDYQ